MAVITACLYGFTSNAQKDTLIQLKDAVLLAEQRYHLVKSHQYEADAAMKAITVAKHSKLPAIDISYQAGYGSANNLIGIFYPGNILPMTGPPSITNNYSGGTGSAASALLNWQALTFGQRNAEINVSVAEANSKLSEFRQFLFQHKINVLSAYLDLLLAYAIVSVHHHNIERAQANLRQSRVLANTGIKPGVDTALFLSELSKARIDSLNAWKQLLVYRLVLQQMIVTDALPVPADTAFLNNLPAPATSNDTSFSNTPIIRLIQSEVVISQSKEQFLRKSFLPKLNLWASGFARGSAFQPTGEIKTWDGLGLTRFNYGAGIQLTFPIMKYGEVRKQIEKQQFISKSAAEKLEDSKLALNTQRHIAEVSYTNSVLIASETMQQLKTSEYAFSAMQTRYATGLVNFSDLIQAQYNLLKAELDLKQSRWDVWKALLLQAAIKGNENIFLNEIR
ncbi:MAG: TolC family protein [Bacteroidetes bacterium]|nr:TolC family protein [Bacteroidota bacterium]